MAPQAAHDARIQQLNAAALHGPCLPRTRAVCWPFHHLAGCFGGSCCEARASPEQAHSTRLIQVEAWPGRPALWMPSWSARPSGENRETQRRACRQQTRLLLRCSKRCFRGCKVWLGGKRGGESGELSAFLNSCRILPRPVLTRVRCQLCLSHRPFAGCSATVAPKTSAQQLSTRVRARSPDRLAPRRCRRDRLIRERAMRAAHRHPAQAAL